MSEYNRWFTDKWWISPLNFSENVLNDFNFPKKVYVRDSTIREGEETPGVYYTLEDKIAIVEKLEEVGVGDIDVGYIGRVQEQWDLANKIKELGLKIKTYCHLSSNPIKWDEEIQKASDAKVDYIGYGIVLTPWQLELFTGDNRVSPQVMLNIIPLTLRKIRKYGGTAILDCVDATRSDLTFLKDAIKRGIKHGVKKVLLYDTVGACHPRAISYMIKEIKPICGDIPLGIHIHDDFGLATASSIAAVEQGVEFMDLVVNQLGDRAGNASLEEVVVSLKILYGIDTGIDLSKLYELSKLVEEKSGIKIPPNKPVVGENTFLHESELHVMSAIKKDKFWMCFTPYKDKVVGQREQLIFGPTTLHGDAIRFKCEELKFDEYEKYLNNIKHELRDIISKKKFVTEPEFEQIILKYKK